MDFIVAMVTNNEKVLTSDQLAASWGYYDTVKSAWNLDLLGMVSNKMSVKGHSLTTYSTWT